MASQTQTESSSFLTPSAASGWLTVEVSSKPQMIEGKRPTFLKAQHSREYSGMDDLPSIIRSHVFLKQSSARSLYSQKALLQACFRESSVGSGGMGTPQL